jgi:hypothetical protein
MKALLLGRCASLAISIQAADVITMALRIGNRLAVIEIDNLG